MKFRILIFILISFLWFGINSSAKVLAGESIDCPDRYATIINPVRGRNFWSDKSLRSIEDQYKAIEKNGFVATWLLQYDVTEDFELLEKVKSFSNKQELGVFLEVTEGLAKEARVIYPNQTPWFSPKAVFLSGYSQSERIRLIDTLFAKFKDKLGFYPKSVGAWWIDSYSLHYIKQKYQISSVLIVADQRTTDSYGVWGQWWGVAYYPAKSNILIPANSEANKLDLVVTQWAQRDPTLAYGDGSKFSNYSLQANDYIRQGLDTDYFKKLTAIYLNCQNKIGQITVGLETGIESIGYIKEYENQMAELKKIKNLKVVTMSEFSENYKRVYPQFPKKNIINDGISSWTMTPEYRENKQLNDYISYSEKAAFADYFVADKENFLNRKLPLNIFNRESFEYSPGILLLITIAVSLLVAIYFKDIRVWVSGSLFSIAAYGLVFKSTDLLGWRVFYGPVIDYLFLVQAVLFLFGLALIKLLSKKLEFFRKRPILIWLFPLVYGADVLVKYLRFSVLNGEYVIGISLDAFRIVGFKIVNLNQIKLINEDYLGYVAQAFLKFDFNKIWDNVFISFMVYPLVHILITFVMGFLLSKLNIKLVKVFVIILGMLFLIYLKDTYLADPRVVR